MLFAPLCGPMCQTLNKPKNSAAFWNLYLQALPVFYLMMNRKSNTPFADDDTSGTMRKRESIPLIVSSAAASVSEDAIVPVGSAAYDENQKDTLDGVEFYTPPDDAPAKAESYRPRGRSNASHISTTSQTTAVEIEMEEIDRKRKTSDVADDTTQSEVLRRANMYQTKKTIAQGLLDIALLTANASQLKNLMETENHPFYTLSLTLLCTSIVLQIVVAVILLMLGRMDMDTSDNRNNKHGKAAVLFNDIAITGVFLITTVNIFIAAFISHGKAYIPSVDAAASWNEKMYQQQKSLWEPVGLRTVGNSTN